MEHNDPVISVDAKKKELSGNLRNNEKEWKHPDEFNEVNVYNFLADAEGMILLYGVYGMKRNDET